MRSVASDPHSGSWYFEVAAEQKSCHFAQPRPTSEHVDFIVVEGGESMEGWAAGIVRVHDTDWHRVSYLQETESGVSPVVISQVQTYDNRTEFVSTRHYFPPGFEEEESNFVGVDLEMEWPHARDYCRAHYHDLASIHNDEENLAVAEECERIRNGETSTSTSHVCYFGFNDVESEGQFVWSDASAVTYTSWAGGEPNDWAPENGGDDWGGFRLELGFRDSESSMKSDIGTTTAISQVAGISLVSSASATLTRRIPGATTRHQHQRHIVIINGISASSSRSRARASGARTVSSSPSTSTASISQATRSRRSARRAFRTGTGTRPAPVSRPHCSARRESWLHSCSPRAGPLECT